MMATSKKSTAGIASTNKPATRKAGAKPAAGKKGVASASGAAASAAKAAAKAPAKASASGSPPKSVAKAGSSGPAKTAARTAAKTAANTAAKASSGSAATSAKVDGPSTTKAAATPGAKRVPNAAFMKPMTPSAALAKVIGAKPLPRTEVTRKIWEYIKKHKLQDADNKRQINGDAALAEVFGKPSVTMFEMTQLVGKHLS